MNVYTGAIQMSKLRFISIAFPLIALVACGGGGGGGSGTSPATSSYTGQYIDAPVKGLSYIASPSGLKGTMDDNGNFSFQAGDTVSFNVVTPGGNIAVGSVAPATPVSQSTTVPISVMAMSGGTQIAQTLQSLGGTGASIDVSSTNPKVAAVVSAADVTSVNNFVSSGGATTPPAAVVTVQSTTAFTNAMASLSNLSTASPTPQTLNSVFNGSTSFHAGPMTTVTINNKADSTFTIINSGISYAKSDGSSYNICISSPIIANPSKYKFQDFCVSKNNSLVDTTTEKWAIDSTSNKINFTSSGSTTVVTLPVIDNTTGIYNLAVNSTDGSSWKGTGLFYMVSTSFSPSYFAGKTVTVSGDSKCSDGYMNYSMSSDGASYTKSCKTSAASGVTFVSSIGKITAIKEIPGVLQFTDSGASTSTYVGQINGGTISAGRFAGAVLGDSTCYTSSTGSCGGVSVFNYTAK